MMSMHIETMDSVVRYHQDRVAQSVQASREGIVPVALRRAMGIALIRAGEWLRRDAMPARQAPALPRQRMRPAHT
jgi:hypothetical protein